MYSNTILKLDLIIIIIQKYCFKYLKPDKNIDKIKKSKTIQFVLDQLNDIRKTKDFKVLKSIFTIEKKYKIKDLKDWLNTLCANNFKLFSKHFKLDVEIDMTKGYRTYVNLLSRLGNNKTKVDLKESNKKISILFNLLFYSFKNTEIKGGTLEEALRERLLGKKVITFIERQLEIKRLIAIGRAASGSSRGIAEPGAGAGASRGMPQRQPLRLPPSSANGPKQPNILWNKLRDFTLNESKSGNLFLKLLMATPRQKQSTHTKLLSKILQLEVKDLIHKKKFVDYWRVHFAKIVPHLPQLVSVFKTEYVDKNYERLDAGFIRHIKKLGLEAQNCVCLALLLNLWTHKGNTWIYESLIQKTSSPSQEYSLLNTFFGHFYIDYLRAHMVQFAAHLTGDKAYLLTDSNFTTLIKDDRNNLEAKYICVLSLLARYFSININKRFFEENNNKSINVYFGTKSQVVQEVFNKKFVQLPVRIPQSASRDFEIALDFADGNKDPNTGIRTIVVYKIKGEDNAIYSAVPLEFLSNYTFEQEILLVPQTLAGPSDIAVATIRNSQTITISPELLQTTLVHNLTVYSGTAQDLIDLGERRINFIFIGDTSPGSFLQIIQVILNKNKFIQNVRNKIKEKEKENLDTVFTDINIKNIRTAFTEENIEDIDIGDIDLTDLDLDLDLEDL